MRFKTEDSNSCEMLMGGEWECLYVECLIVLLSIQGKIKFPPKSYIVDLMHEPGCLIPADAPDAEQYKRL